MELFMVFLLVCFGVGMGAPGMSTRPATVDYYHQCTAHDHPILSQRRSDLSMGKTTRTSLGSKGILSALLPIVVLFVITACGFFGNNAGEYKCPDANPATAATALALFAPNATVTANGSLAATATRVLLQHRPWVTPAKPVQRKVSHKQQT
ncbi:MAG: hypothetical protein R2932_43905 [Caldilineaceae bacterium]